MPFELLYAFRAFDPITKRWYRARYRATEADIRQRYAQFELLGEPERRELQDPNAVTPSRTGPDPKP